MIAHGVVSYDLPLYFPNILFSAACFFLIYYSSGDTNVTPGLKSVMSYVEEYIPVFHPRSITLHIMNNCYDDILAFDVLDITRDVEGCDRILQRVNNVNRFSSTQKYDFYASVSKSVARVIKSIQQILKSIRRIIKIVSDY